MQIADARLYNINVVMIADKYHPDIVYRNLVNGETMPEGLIIDRSDQVFGDECEVTYNNGVSITVTPQKTTIGKEYNELFNEFRDDQVPVLAAEFVKAYSDVTYDAIGFNYYIAMQHSDPFNWMTRKFLKAKSPPKNVSMMPQFLIKTDDTELMLAFTSVEVTGHGQQNRFVAIDCNHHHNGPFKTNADILRMVTKWQDTRDIILSSLEEVLKLE